MRKILVAAVLIMGLFLVGFKTPTGIEKSQWIGQSTFKIVTGKTVIYTDPLNIAKADKADLILITHQHGDHCSPDDVKKLLGKNTVIVATQDSIDTLKAGGVKADFKAVKAGSKLKVKGIAIEAVPAYNIVEGRQDNHPKNNGWVGYIFNIEGKRVYLAGDTDRIPEMKKFKADVAILPVGGTYTMTAEEAAQAVLDTGAKVAIPMHYGSIVGTYEDAKKFAKALKGKVDVIIKSPAPERFVKENLTWFGHDVFSIRGNSTIVYTDPYKLVNEDTADIIFVTHSHDDHCSPEDIKKILNENTVVVTNKESADKLLASEELKGVGFTEKNIAVVKPGDKLELKGVDIQVVPAYNIAADRIGYHPKENGGLGFIFTSDDGSKVYLAGDTDVIPEMKKMQVDVALLPIGGTYTMNIEEAVKAVLAVQARTVIPMHYNTFSEIEADPNKFAELLKGKTSVVIMENQNQ